VLLIILHASKKQLAWTIADRPPATGRWREEYNEKNVRDLLDPNQRTFGPQFDLDGLIPSQMKPIFAFPLRGMQHDLESGCRYKFSQVTQYPTIKGEIESDAQTERFTVHFLSKTIHCFQFAAKRFRQLVDGERFQAIGSG
jgi:hypothetical protein